MKALNKNEMRNINGGYDVKCKYCGRTFKDKTYGFWIFKWTKNWPAVLGTAFENLR